MHKTWNRLPNRAETENQKKSHAKTQRRQDFHARQAPTNAVIGVSALFPFAAIARAFISGLPATTFSPRLRDAQNAAAPGRRYAHTPKHAPFDISGALIILPDSRRSRIRFPYETNLSTFQAHPEASAWFSGPDENKGWPRHDRPTASTRPEKIAPRRYRGPLRSTHPSLRFKCQLRGGNDIGFPRLLGSHVLPILNESSKEESPGQVATWFLAYSSRPRQIRTGSES